MKKNRNKLEIKPLCIDGYSDDDLTKLYLAFQLSREKLTLMYKLKDNSIALLYY